MMARELDGLLPPFNPPSAGTQIGHLIGASFGLGFMVANSGTLNPALHVTALTLAVAAFLVVVIAFGRTRRRTKNAADNAETLRFNKPYRLVVVIEAIALIAGLAILRQIQPSVILGWIALVVGLHFIALAYLWMRNIEILTIGIAMVILGITGTVIGFYTQQADAVALISGVGSGIVLLGWTLAQSIRTLFYRRT